MSNYTAKPNLNISYKIKQNLAVVSVIFQTWILMNIIQDKTHNSYKLICSFKLFY